MRNDQILVSAKSIAKKILNHGHEVYFVGGFVRSHIMQRNYDDIDIVTSATHDELSRIFNISHVVGKSFGVINVVYHGHIFEIATFREDFGYENFRKPSRIQHGTLTSDVYRRDFTINAIYMNPFTMEIIDLVNGTQDIKNKIIRAVGNAYDRICEDRLRIVRAIRFAAVLNFKIDNDIIIHIPKLEIFPWVSIPRYSDEIIKANKSGVFFSFMKLMHKHGVLRQFFGDIEFDFSKNIENFLKKNQDMPMILKIVAILYKNDVSNIPRKMMLSKMDEKYVHLFLDIKKLLEKSDLDKYELIKTLAKPWYKYSLILACFIHGMNDPRRVTFAKSTAFDNEQEILSMMSGKHPINGKMLRDKKILPGPIYKKIIEESWKMRINKQMSIEDIALNIDDIIDTCSFIGS